MTKYDSLANLEGYKHRRTGGKQRATAEVRYVTRTRLSNMSLSVVDASEMRQKTGVGRLLGIFGERVADSPALPYPFWLLAVALLLCTLLCKGIDARGVYEQIVAVAELSCIQTADK